MVDHIKAQLAAQGIAPPNARKRPATATNARHPTKDTNTPPASIVGPKTSEDVTPPPTVAETHYIGRYQLNVANGTHYPGRMRAVLVGPADAELIKCLTAALNHFTKQP